jgi:cytochrome P450
VSAIAVRTHPILCSVIITAYNYGRYLKRAVDSVISQDFDSYEIIVVDDGSEDATRALAASYGNRIRYVHQAHSGPFVAARNGFRLARGNRIMYVDADDRLRPGALKRLHEVAAAHPEVALILGKTCSINSSDGTAFYDEGLELSDNSVQNFARFCRGGLKAPIAGGLIDASLLRMFDREPFDYPGSMDLVILGMGLLKGCVQADHYTLDVFAHDARLRDQINYIHQSGVRLVGVLFDPSTLPFNCMGYRREFLAFLERERTRSYYRSGWYSLSWRSYRRAVAAAPTSLLHLRSLRRFLTSLVLSALRKDEGPVASPSSHWLFGHQLDFYGNAIAFTAKTAERLRTNIRLNLQRRTYLIRSEQDVEHVLRHNSCNYQPAGIARIFPPFAYAVLGTLHPQHGLVRSWLATFFNAKCIAAWAPMIGAILDRRIAGMSAGTLPDIAQVIRSANFEVASWIILGCDSPGVMQKLDHAIMKSHSYSTRILRSFIRLPHWVPLRAQRVIRKADKDIGEIFDFLVSQDTANSPNSMLHQMLAERKQGGGASLQDIRYNTIGLMLASTEPVAVTTTLALHVLGKDPVLQERLVDEIMRAKVKTTDRRLDSLPRSLSELRTLVHLNRFIDEVHRFYPAEWLLTRRAERTDRLPSGLLVRRGTQVMINLNDLQRNTRRFSEPDRFDPERFRHGGAARSNGSYLPFGAGATACLGQPLARFIMAISLVTMLSRWRVESPEDQVPLESLNCFSLAIKGPVSMHLHDRAITDPTNRGGIRA